MRLVGASKSMGALYKGSLAAFAGVALVSAAPAFAGNTHQQDTWTIASSSTPSTTPHSKQKTVRRVSAGSSAALMHAYRELGQSNFDQAITDLCNILRADSNDIYARRYLCYALLATADYKNCLVQLDVLARFNRAIAFDLCMRADALQALGQGDKAVETLKAANGMAPDNDYIRDALIRQLQASDKLPEAIAACAEGYYKTRDTQARQRYLELYYQIGSEQQLASQEARSNSTSASADYKGSGQANAGAAKNKSNWVPASKDAPSD